jgi:preprotein translocase subunit SecG
MLEILLIVQIVISLLLIGVILLQRTGADSLSGLSGGGNTGVVSARAAANFLTRTTVILASLFILNSIVLANLSSKTHSDSIEKKIEQEAAKPSEPTPEVK